MAAEWYYVKDMQQVGPVSAGELKQLVVAGEVLPDDLVWTEKLSDWVQARQVKGLVPANKPAATAAPSEPAASPKAASAAAAATAEPVTPQPAPATFAETAPEPAVGFPAMEEPAFPAGEVNIDVAPAESAEGKSPYVRVNLARMRRRRAASASVALGLASVALIAAMFIPWWSITGYKRDSLEESLQKELENVKNDPGMLYVLQGARSVSPDDEDSDTRLDELRNRWIRSHPKTDSVIKDDVKWANDRARISKNLKQRARVRKKEERAGKEFEKTAKWWDKAIGDWIEHFKELAEEVQDKGEATLYAWGWKSGVAITGLVFGIVILVASIVCSVVPILRNWSWTVSGVAAVMGLVGAILGIIWIVKAPGPDFPRFFKQGLHVGPYMFLVGAAVFFLVGLFDMISGIKFLVRHGVRQ